VGRELFNVTAHCGQAAGSAWANGAILDTIGLLRFRDELERLHQTLSGEAVLELHEPNVVVRVATTMLGTCAGVWRLLQSALAAIGATKTGT
jgi:multisubunit Na+/H+ antiporter MnhG subunit